MDGKYFNEVVKGVVIKRQFYHLIIQNNTPRTYKLITEVWLRTFIILQNIYKHHFIIKNTKSILSRYYSLKIILVMCNIHTYKTINIIKINFQISKIILIIISYIKFLN